MLVIVTVLFGLNSVFLCIIHFFLNLRITDLKQLTKCIFNRPSLNINLPRFRFVFNASQRIETL